MFLKRCGFSARHQVLTWLGWALLMSLGFPLLSGAQQATAQTYTIVQDLPYESNGSEYAAERCKLDLYLPKEGENFPVVVWFHGGALHYESKEEGLATGVAKRLASEGIGVVLPNYRLYPRAKYPEFIEDAASAVAWVYSHITTYQGNPHQIFVGGHSAGAYLAAMIALDDHYLKRHDLSSQQILGVIPISGQMSINSPVRAERGIPSSTRVDESAPLFHARREAPPWLCMCGERDNFEICEQNQEFAEALRAAGHPSVMFEEIPGRTHFTIVGRIAEADDPVAKLILTFIHQTISEE